MNIYCPHCGQKYEGLISMVTTRKEALDRIASQRFIVLKHFVCLKVAKSKLTVHWTKEINTFLSHIYPLKLKDKTKLTSKDYYNQLWDNQAVESVTVKQIIQSLKSDGYELKKFDESELFTQLQNIINKLSKKLATTTFNLEEGTESLLKKHGFI